MLPSWPCRGGKVDLCKKLTTVAVERDDNNEVMRVRFLFYWSSIKSSMMDKFSCMSKDKTRRIEFSENPNCVWKPLVPFCFNVAYVLI